MDRRALGSWLSAPGQLPDLDEATRPPQDWRGQRLGLPPAGPGSVAPAGRRVIALMIDWITAMLVAGFFAPFGSDAYSLAVLAVFAVQVTLLQWLMGSSFGQRIVGLAVVRVDGGRLGILPLVARTALICLVIPPLIWDSDTRGLHDRAARTVCVLR